MPFKILLVEDNPTDVELVAEALACWKNRTQLNVVEDGDEAIQFLRRGEPYTGAPAPDLILLDLNLPKRSGEQVLEEIKGDAELAQIPVIVLTTSDREKDVRTCYRLHANCYVTKSMEIGEFQEKIKGIEEFWLHHARIPKN